MLKSLTISLLLFCSAITTWSQPVDSLVKKSYRPTGIRLGTDIISLAKIPFSDEFDGWEITADVDFYRYYFTVEVGNWEKSLVGESQSYFNSGNYYRLGADVNILLKDPDRNMVFLGLRYARSDFQEQLNYIDSDPVFGDIQQNLTNSNMSAGWGEVTVGLRVKIWKELWMGYTARLKVAPGLSTSGQFDTYDIPGYGLASKNTYWGFNYQVYYRFGW